MKLSAQLPRKCPKSITWGQRWSYEGSSQTLSGTLLPPSLPAFLPLSWDKHNKVLFLPHSPLAWWAQWLLLYQWSHQHIFELGLYLERKGQRWFPSLQIMDTATIPSTCCLSIPSTCCYLTFASEEPWQAESQTFQHKSF